MTHIYNIMHLSVSNNDNVCKYRLHHDEEVVWAEPHEDTKRRHQENTELSFMMYHIFSVVLFS